VFEYLYTGDYSDDLSHDFEGRVEGKPSGQALPAISTLLATGLATNVSVGLLCLLQDPLCQQVSSVIIKGKRSKLGKGTIRRHIQRFRVSEVW
jgi:hypothetical protein